MSPTMHSERTHDSEDTTPTGTVPDLPGAFPTQAATAAELIALIREGHDPTDLGALIGASNERRAA